tara:strand:- start:3823 stop:4116 length:294 start_codon:yes stop_codon:yes gene_type:complete
MVNIKSATTLALPATSNSELNRLYKMINGQNISSKIVITMDNFGKGHHDAFDDKFLTVLSKCIILVIPDTTNIHSKHRTATIFGINVMIDMIDFLYT